MTTENPIQGATNPTDSAPLETPASAAPVNAEPAGNQQAQADSVQSQQATPASDPAVKPDSASEGAPEGGKEPQVGAPEKYEFTPPEGKLFDPGIIQEYSDVAKELNLTQDAAEKMLTTLAPKIEERQAALIAEQIATTQESWVSATKADKEIGGEKLQANLAIANKALATFGTPELNTLLQETRLAEHPEIIRAFYRAGISISEDTFVGGGSGTELANKSVAQRMYPDMNP